MTKFANGTEITTGYEPRPDELASHDETLRKQIVERSRDFDPYQGPVKYVVEYFVRTKDARRGYAPQVGQFFTHWEREARENANNRAEITGLPIFEIGPEHDHDAVLRRAPDGIYLCYVCRIENGPVVRDPARMLPFDACKLALISKRGPPTLSHED